MHHKQCIFHSLPTATVAYVLTHKVKTLLYSWPVFICPLALFSLSTPDSLSSLCCWPVSCFFLQPCTHTCKHTDMINPWVQIWNKYSEKDSSMCVAVMFVMCWTPVWARGAKFSLFIMALKFHNSYCVYSRKHISWTVRSNRKINR